VLLKRRFSLTGPVLFQQAAVQKITPFLTNLQYAESSAINCLAVDHFDADGGSMFNADQHS
jgi:hypothetical protein